MDRTDHAKERVAWRQVEAQTRALESDFNLVEILRRHYPVSTLYSLVITHTKDNGERSTMAETITFWAPANIAREFGDLEARCFQEKPDKNNLRVLEKTFRETTELWIIVFDLDKVVRELTMNNYRLPGLKGIFTMIYTKIPKSTNRYNL